MRRLLAAPAVHRSGAHAPGWVEIDDVSGTVVAVGDGDPPRPPDELLDGVLAPGLVDAQLNGAVGVDAAAADDEGWIRLVRALPPTGVTSFVPTFITAPVEDLVTQLRAFRDRLDDLGTVAGAARVLPAHVEGPFLSPAHRGAHRAECLVEPTPERVEALIEAGDDALGYVTLAPELPGALDAIERFVAAGVRVAIGHSDADSDTVRRAADRGASLVTHLYNAQRPLRHRDPGVVGAALTDERLTLGLIADLHHVDPVALDVAFRSAPGRVMLVTDAVAAFGMPAGEYLLGGEPLTVRDGRPPVRADGTIAGAAVGLDTCVGNVVRAAAVSPVAAVEAASQVPARALGRPDLGRIEVDGRADLALLDGETWTARAVWIGARRVS